MPGTQGPEEDIRPPGTGVMDNCKLLLGCWELNPSLPQEKQVFLTAGPPKIHVFKMCFPCDVRSKFYAFVLEAEKDHMTRTTLHLANNLC